jgi:hypothetical protein
VVAEVFGLRRGTAKRRIYREGVAAGWRRRRRREEELAAGSCLEGKGEAKQSVRGDGWSGRGRVGGFMLNLGRLACIWGINLLQVYTDNHTLSA